MIVGLEMRKSVKPEIDAGVIALLYVMERETAQEEMLGALGMLMDIDDAYVRQGSEVAGTAPCLVSLTRLVFIQCFKSYIMCRTGFGDINNNRILT